MKNLLIHANKPVSKKLGRPNKRASAKIIETGKSKRAVIPTPCNEIRYDQIGHWPETFEKKDHCGLCQAYSQTRCSKCSFLYVS